MNPTPLTKKNEERSYAPRDKKTVSFQNLPRRRGGKRNNAVADSANAYFPPCRSTSSAIFSCSGVRGEVVTM